MEIADWLRRLSLERYAEAFRDNAIDVAVLPELSEADLEKFGGLLAQMQQNGSQRSVGDLNHPP